MPGAKKFGTFGGVFTPAILTILGVIMYLRLPWIVGQAGLYSVIGIILVAHIISVTTGLSVSSIATDKRVKTGGTYYMISRSLGLPIGGTLGLALFVGLSFSVSLYLIGFSESFLGFWGIEVTKNTIRLAGSIALLGVTTITLISTSLALKTQFFILLAIILSLGSIFLGQAAELPSQLHLTPIAGAAPFIVLFGIFFPAVTGFEAGVSMSGDLENPKKSIPIGTIAAILVGLGVYLGMAVFFAMRVSPDQLANNPNVLLDISFFPPLVLAGIWGATLSSALGSILGAPRILQAISIDKITPRFFGIGYGKENEPRNALLMTFVIAEAGILVGELDVIARVVSMFFITTYGFLNLSCAIENWASPDFRPDFRISKLVSLLGTATCLIVMIQLDLVAMIGAILLLSLLFFYLKRKELTLESGDTWEGVWSSVIRAGLDYLNKGKLQQRNWRPNIILFSGSSTARPHLLDLGKRLVDKRGMLSSFDLVETKGAKPLFSKREQSLSENDETTRGIYARRVACEDVYGAMETISKFYGFSGLEPNTVLMGWGRNSQQPDAFVRVIKTIISLDNNLMLLSYDESRGFGKHRKIDIWWRGMGNAVAFAASLCRFLTSSDEWRHAEIRFLLITNRTSLVERLHTVMNQLIEDFRFEATVKVINNAIEQKPFYEIIKQESKDADLIINGIPDIQPGEEFLYVSKTNAIIDSLGTVLLIRASSFFKDVYSNVAREAAEPNLEVQDRALSPVAARLESDLPDVPIAAVKRMENLMVTVQHHFEKEYLLKLQQHLEKPIRAFQSLINGGYEVIQQQFPTNLRVKNQRLVSRTLADLLYQMQKRLEDYLQESSTVKQELLSEAINWVVSRIDSIPAGLPEIIKLPRAAELLAPVAGDPLRIRIDKRCKRISLRLFKKPVFSTVRFKALATHHLQLIYREKWALFLSDYVIRSLQHYSEMQFALDSVVDSLGTINQQLFTKTELPTDKMLLELDHSRQQVKRLTELMEQRLKLSLNQLATNLNTCIKELLFDLASFESHHRLQHKRKSRNVAESLLERIHEIPDTWSTNHQIMVKTVIADLVLLSFKNRVGTVIRRAKSESWLSIENNLLDEIATLTGHLTLLAEGKKSSQETMKAVLTCFKGELDIERAWDHVIHEIRLIINDLPELAEAVAQESIQGLSGQTLKPLVLEEISLKRRIEFFFESKLLGPLGEELKRTHAIIGKIAASGADVIRLLSVGLVPAGTESMTAEVSEAEALHLIIKDSLARLNDANTAATTARQELDQAVNRLLQEALEAINLYSLAGAGDHLEEAIKAEREFWLIRRLKPKARLYSDRLLAFITSILYRQSAVSLIRKGEHPTYPLRESPVDHLLDFIESVSPNPETISALPFYYRHLFLGKPAISKEFWIGRNNELQQAAKAVNRFRNGKVGGLAIIGEPGSGKTALCQTIAARHFEKQKIFLLTPPDVGTADPAIFEQHLKLSLGLSRDETLLPDHWPKNSVLIIDDIGCWWQRRENGYQIIETIARLIREAGNRCLFLINANTVSFHFLNQLWHLEDWLLDVISCQRLDIKALQEIILVRHRSTGLKLIYKQKEEEALSGWVLARFFTRCLSDCEGNVGMALKKWIGCIESVSKEKVGLSIPNKPDLSKLSHLDSNLLILLTQLLLHSRLNRSSLAMIMKMDEIRLAPALQFLKRSGIIVFDRGEIIRLNLFALDYLARYLRQKGLL